MPRRRSRKPSSSGRRSKAPLFRGRMTHWRGGGRGTGGGCWREGGDGLQGFIGFAMSARMSEALHKAILQVPEGQWEVYGEAHAKEIRECAEIDFVPAEKSEHKDTAPLRYVAIRIRPRQEELFADGSKVKHFALVRKREEGKPGRLIQWHLEKAGTIEGVHDVLKNELAGGVMPCKYFGANAAWLRLAVFCR